MSIPELVSAVGERCHRYWRPASPDSEVAVERHADFIGDYPFTGAELVVQRFVSESKETRTG